MAPPWQSPKRKKKKSQVPRAEEAGAGPTSRQGSEDKRTEDQEEPWEEHLQRLLHQIPNGAREYEHIISKVNKAMESLLQDSKLEKKILEVVKEEKEMELCSRSLMAFNVDKWKGEDKDEDVSLEEKITEDLHRMTKHRVTVTEVVTFKQQEGRPMTARITLGSSRQKRTLFRAIADNTRKKTKYGSGVQAISLRDCFTRNNVPEAKKLAAKGMAIKRQGKISAFRVISQGPACIPVLQTRTEKGHWVVHQIHNDLEDNMERDTC